MSTPKTLKEVIKEEYKKCLVDPIYFMKKYVKIQHPIRGTVNFDLYPFQEEALTDLVEHDFNIILKCAINDTNGPTLIYLREGIEHAIEYFTKNLLDLINNRIDPDTHISDSDYGLLNDIAKVITNQILFRNKLEELNKFLLAL